MESTLLATKLFIPPAQPWLVPRPRLVHLLRDVFSHGLTLVSAPPGFGKTTILSQWINGSHPPIPTAWLSLEESENDPSRFWQYFIAALRTLQPNVGHTTLALLRASQPVPIQSALVGLINDLAQVDREIVPVLDDYHFIKSPQIDDGLTFFIEHMPPRMHMIVATRTDPLIPLARFRGKGDMMEIDANDLRFTIEESTELLCTLADKPLPPDASKAIHSRSEGWVVGLKMAALSLAKQGDVGKFIGAFTSSQRYIMDYLTEEVLEQQRPQVRDFLLKTSILERLTPALCDAVTERTGGHEMLLRLEKENLFLVPLDNSMEWYRYHHLFAELLKHQLRAKADEREIASLHLQASQWNAREGLVEPAINHALLAQAWETAMNLIVSPRAQLGTVACALTRLGWLRRIPEETLHTNVPLHMECAWLLERTAQYYDAERHLAKLDGLARSDAHLRGEIAVLRAFIASDVKDFRRTEDYARLAISLLPSDDYQIGLVSGPLAGMYMTQKRFAEAEPLIRRNYESLRKRGNDQGAIGPLIYVGWITFLKGNLHEAADLYTEAINLARGDANNLSVCLAHLYLGDIHYERNDLGRAVHEHQQAIQNYRSSRAFGSMQLDQAYYHLARTLTAIGDADAAVRALESADQSFPDYEKNPTSLAARAGFRAALAFMRGDDECSSRWTDSLAEFEESIPLEAPVLAQYLLDLRRSRNSVREQLKADYEFFATQGLALVLIRTRLRQALNSVNPGAGLEFFADSLRMAKPQGSIRVFVDLGMSLVPLLREASLRGVEPEYSRKLVAIIEAEERQRKVRRGELPAVDSSGGLLSEREIEVIKLVAEGLSNQQIADRLRIGLSTTKTHVYHIFDKLDAKDRLQAVNRAKDLRLF